MLNEWKRKILWFGSNWSDRITKWTYLKFEFIIIFTIDLWCKHWMVSKSSNERMNGADSYHLLNNPMNTFGWRSGRWYLVYFPTTKTSISFHVYKLNSRSVFDCFSQLADRSQTGLLKWMPVIVCDWWKAAVDVVQMYKNWLRFYLLFLFPFVIEMFP